MRELNDLRLMPYMFEVQYQPGRENIADALSRLIRTNEKKNSEQETRTENYVRFVAKEVTPTALSTRQVEEASKVDDELIGVRRCLKDNKWDGSTVQFAAVKNELCCVGYLVVRGTRLVIPQQLRMRCVEISTSRSLRNSRHKAEIENKSMLATHGERC